MPISAKKDITIREVAEKAGVSQATVGRVIGGYGSVSQKTKDKVLVAIKDMNYVPNAIAQSMKRKNTNTIGVVVGNVANPFFSELLHSIENIGAANGYSIIISNTGEDTAQEIASLRMLISKQVDGVLIATTQNSNVILDESVKMLYTGSVPMVYVDREVFGIGELCVKTDHFGGAFDATNYLIAKGHKKIGLIAGIHASTMYQRIDGYKKALEVNGIDYNKNYIKFGRIASIEEGTFFAKELLKTTDVTAIIPLNDLLTMGTLIALHDMKIKVPDDISIIGWDDFPLSGVTSPPITTISQDVARIGEIAMDKLLQGIKANIVGRSADGEKRITLSTRMIERESCREIGSK